MVGYDPDLGGGPWLMAAGRGPEADDEIVLDAVMAEDHGLQIGDSITIADEDFEIVGLSAETSSCMANFFFIKKEAAEDLLLTPGMTSFLLIRARPGYDLAGLETRLARRLHDVEVLPATVLKQNDIDLLVKIFAVPLQVMVTTAFAVGTAILGMIIYTSTLSRAREYGVLKAIGTGNPQLYLLVSLQALFIASIGVVLGIALAWLMGGWIMSAYPKFLIVFESGRVIPAVGTGLAMGLLAALLPARYLGRLDPASIFRK
jgi:putative ABC transport system permease protein